jgi:hypothetical protein
VRKAICIVATIVAMGLATTVAAANQCAAGVRRLPAPRPQRPINSNKKDPQHGTQPPRGPSDRDQPGRNDRARA